LTVQQILFSSAAVFSLKVWALLLDIRFRTSLKSLHQAYYGTELRGLFFLIWCTQLLDIYVRMNITNLFVQMQRKYIAFLFVTISIIILCLCCFAIWFILVFLASASILFRFPPCHTFSRCELCTFDLGIHGDMCIYILV